MAPTRFVVQTSALLVLLLCWSVNADTDTETTTPQTLTPGFVTNYITPLANLSLEKLVGRWYMAEGVPFDVPADFKAHLCILLDFRYDENGTLVVVPKSLLDGVRTSPLYAYPVSENGVWDTTYIRVSGEEELTHSSVVVHLDERFLAVGACSGYSADKCGALVAVRDVADAGRQEELRAVHRRLAAAGVAAARGDFASIVAPCRAVAAAPYQAYGYDESATPATE